MGRSAEGFGGTSINTDRIMIECSNCKQERAWNFATSRRTGKRICDACERLMV